MSVANSIKISFKGSKGNQFGRNTYVTMIPFNKIESFFKVFPEVQRKLSKPRAKSIAKYILDGIDKKRMTFLSAITVTCKNEIQYNEEESTIDVDISTVFSINDGQHRSEAIKLAITTLKNNIENSNNHNEREKLIEKLNILENMTIPVVIFTGIDQKGEQQLFHDLNLLAGKPNKSIALNFDSSDLYNRLAKYLTKNNEQLLRLNIETEKTQIRGNNNQIMVLSTLRNMLCYIITGTNIDKEGTLNIETYNEFQNTLDEITNLLFEVLPADASNREKYIIGTAATIQGIGKYLNEVIYNKNNLDWQSEIKKLSTIDWSHSSSVWEGYGGSYIPEKNKFVFTGTSAGINGVYEALTNALNKH
ncbi:DGQHR domain-containing protein [Brevibacillus laterosporus]|uniref:DNA sulfur modification protein DndB n=1 Tax=Brevibacillus laterosporus TaxID=1465 RepID=UPI002406462C|nr:DNA sulfur modification protein DndB [Brevibacillus laterosporus]MDF9412478.1 DGQHR domain-containing protein [Brevibacillus laterosporus]